MVGRGEFRTDEGAPLIVISHSAAALAGAAMALLVIGATWALWTGLRAWVDARDGRG